MNAPTRDQLLEKYATREPKAFSQFDGFDWTPDDDDDSIFGGIKDSFADDDGHGIFGTTTHELMHGADVRVLVNPAASKETVLALLSKITSWIEGDGLRASRE